MREGVTGEWENVIFKDLGMRGICVLPTHPFALKKVIYLANAWQQFSFISLEPLQFLAAPSISQLQLIQKFTVFCL